MLVTLTEGPRDGTVVDLTWTDAPEVLWVTDEDAQRRIDEAEARGEEVPDAVKNELAALAYVLVDTETDALGVVHALYRHTTDVCQCDHTTEEG